MLPSRRTLRSSSTRKSFACVGAGISPISSSSSVPASASSKQPMRRSAAPVKAPRSWPKISLSINVSGMAEQLMATNGPVARGESLWIVRATISFPEPVSPVISTDAELGAAISTMRITSCIALDAPTRSPSLPASRSCRCRTSSCLASRALLSARSSSARKTGPLSGFSMYQKAPASMAATARSSLPLPVIMMAGTSINSLPSCFSRSNPFIPGNSTSAISVSGW